MVKTKKDVRNPLSTFTKNGMKVNFSNVAIEYFYPSRNQQISVSIRIPIEFGIFTKLMTT